MRFPSFIRNGAVAVFGVVALAACSETSQPTAMLLDDAASFAAVAPISVDGNISGDACLALGSLGTTHGKLEIEKDEFGNLYIGGGPLAGVSYAFSADFKTVSFDAGAGYLVYDVIVKGADAFNRYNYVDGAASDDDLTSPLKNGKLPEISHVNFCWAPVPQIQACVPAVNGDLQGSASANWTVTLDGRMYVGGPKGNGGNNPLVPGSVKFDAIAGDFKSGSETFVITSEKLFTGFTYVTKAGTIEATNSGAFAVDMDVSKDGDIYTYTFTVTANGARHGLSHIAIALHCD